MQVVNLQKVSGYVAAFSNQLPRQVDLSLLHLLAEHHIPGVDRWSKSRAAELLGLEQMLGASAFCCDLQRSLLPPIRSHV